MERNGLRDCVVAYGAVGLRPGQLSTSFHLHPSSAASSVLPYQPRQQLPVKGRITDLTVPAISVASEWTTRFGHAAVDLLKVDIEGKELEFVQYEGAFLHQRVVRIVVEWHKWCVSLSQLDARLDSSRFERRGVFDENELVGLAIYENLDETG
jgi:FkbM family methyltransferase